MKRSRRAKRLWLLLLLPTAVLVSAVSAARPEVVETTYSSGLYPMLFAPISRAVGLLPFSLAEMIVLAAAVLGVVSAARVIRHLLCGRRRTRIRSVSRLVVDLLVAASVLSFAFVLSWQVNYNRMPLSHALGLSVQPSTVDELEALCVHLIQRANALRQLVVEDTLGVMHIPGGQRSVFNRATLGFDALAGEYKVFGGNYGRPKPVLLSRLLSHAGIAGVYFPFTAEANVNVMVPHASLPSTTCHEMAHQRGFAREDEANYVAYLACLAHPDIDFQYSGTFLALVHAMNALHAHDSARYKDLRQTYSPGLKRDMDYTTEFWRQFEGPIERVSTNINDAYLKANRQTDGVASYGRMVDLLLAEYRRGRQ